MASKYAGYMGKVMMVDLTTETVTEYPWSDEQRELYLGGKIMAARILADHLTGKETSFSEENWVVISTGSLTGTGAPSSARFNISALSPQTGILASSNCGGSFGFHLKKAGFDALILKGKCSGRKWLEINEDQLIFHDADALWGMKTGQCQETLAQLVGKKKFGKLCIGPAGENLVKYAGIVSEERAAGRTGLGAVLGWKGLKAITVTGNKNVPIFDKEKTTEWCKKWFTYLQGHPLTGNQLPKLGTAGLVSSMQMHGLLSTKNYSAGQFDDFEMVSGERLAEEFNITNKGSLTCPIRCARTVTVQGKEVKSPELETLGLLGGNICNNDLQKILDWNYLLDELGMDTISTANTIAYAMETISASGQCLFTSYAFFPGFLLTNPNGAITKTINAVAPHIGGAVRLINKCPRIAALHLPVFHHTKMIKLAKEAVKLIHDNILKVFEDGSDLEARQNMQRGAFYAGRAFTRGCVGYVHAIGHTLGGLYGVAHGLAMAVLLPHVMREFGASAHKRLAELADVCGMAGANEAEKANAFIRWIEETNAKMGLPDKFDVVKDEDIDRMITWARKEANPLYPVPVVWGRKDFRRLIESIRK